MTSDALACVHQKLARLETRIVDLDRVEAENERLRSDLERYKNLMTNVEAGLESAETIERHSVARFRAMEADRDRYKELAQALDRNVMLYRNQLTPMNPGPIIDRVRAAREAINAAREGE